MSYDPGRQPGWPQQPGGYPPPPSGGWSVPPGPGPGGFGGGPGSSGSGESVNFFPALFDFGFTRFATFGLIKILYVVGAVLIVLSYLGYVVTTFLIDPVYGILTLIFGAVGALFFLIYLRVGLEFLYAVVRMSNDIHRRSP